jgi:hypothetical protein
VYYIEFYSRKAGVDPETFREVVQRTDAWWAEANPQDRPVLMVGRTWRLGGPEYMRVWQIDSAARIDEWTKQRTSDPDAARQIEEWLEVVDCDAGLYEDLGDEQL